MIRLGESFSKGGDHSWKSAAGFQAPHERIKRHRDSTLLELGNLCTLVQKSRSCRIRTTHLAAQ